MQLSQFDIGWLVGLIEGDGTFTYDGKHPVVAVKMTDMDTVERFAALMKTTVMGPYRYEGQQLGDKPYWISKVTGRRAREFMAACGSRFSARRQQQIRSLVGEQATLLSTTEAA